MSVTLMARTEKYFAESQEAAEQIVEDKKVEHGSYMKQHVITKKAKRDFEYFIVSITVEFCRPNDLLA